MNFDHTESPALTPFELTYSPAYRPSGSPIEPHASRQALQERRTAQVMALSAEGATRHWERLTGQMVTGCTRVQLPSRYALVEGAGTADAITQATGLPALLVAEAEGGAV